MLEHAGPDFRRVIVERAMAHFVLVVAETSNGFRVDPGTPVRDQFKAAAFHMLEFNPDVASLDNYIFAAGATVRTEISVALAEFVRAELFAEIATISRER